MSGRIETFTSEAESSKWSRNKDISIVEAGVDIGSDTGGGSDVSVDQVVTEGREVAGITVDGERTPILIPNAGEWTQSDWAEDDPADDAYIKNKPNLASVATSGSYADLSNTPDLSDFVEDANYVHTDYNYDIGAKNVVDGVSDALAGKVDKVSGKALSDNNYSNADKTKLTNLASVYGIGTNLTLDPQTNILSADAQPITIDSAMSTTSENAVQNKVITAALGDKVDKVQGKVLSDNNYTTAEKDKLAGIDTGAEVNDISTISVNGVNVPADQNKNVNITIPSPAQQVQSDWTEDDPTDAAYIVHKPNLATVATSGDYTDLSNTPTIPTKVSDLSNDSGFITNTVNNLTNYYLKSDTYTQSEVNTLIAAIITLNIEVVQTLPTTNISTTTIYLVPKATAGTQDAYDEYINLDGTTVGWEHIGSTEVDLTNYYTKTETDTLLGNKVDKVSGKGLSTEDYTTAEKTKLAGLSTYSAGDGIDISNGVISTDNLQSGDMSDIIVPLPGVASNRIVYSTTEQVVGEWVDGKPLYQKSFVQTSGSLSDHIMVNHNISNLKVVVYALAMLRKNDNTLQMPMTVDQNGIELNITNTKLELWISNDFLNVLGTNGKYIVHLQYTKTTD